MAAHLLAVQVKVAVEVVALVLSAKMGKHLQHHIREEMVAMELRHLFLEHLLIMLAAGVAAITLPELLELAV